MVTGGDDNAVAVSVLDMEVGDGNMNVKVVHTGGHLAAHGAQITGMFIQCVSRRLVTNGIYHKMSINTTVKLVS